MKLSFNHVAFTVANLEESIKWYEDILGMKQIFTYQKGSVRFVFMRRDEITLELFHFGKDTKPLPEYRKELMDDLYVVGAKHLCIETDNLDESIDQLRKKGVEIAGEIDTAAIGGRFVFFRDCNGILIELYER